MLPEIRPFHRVEQVPARAVGLAAARGVGEREEDAAAVAPEPEEAAIILDAEKRFDDIPGLAIVTTRDDVRANDFSLNIALYVAPLDSGEELPLEQALIDLETAQQVARASRDALETELAKWGLHE